MATEVLMPQMGESIAEGTITKWLVKVGERVERDQPLFEISTDKVDAEIPSPASGVLSEARFPEGATVAVNQVVGLIAGDGEPAKPGAAPPTAAPAPAAAPPPTAVAPTAPAPAAAAPATPATAPAAAPPAAAPTAPAPATSSAPAAAAAAPPPPAGSLEERLRQKSSPLVRSIAAAEGVDISTLQGSGIHGRVTKEDIQKYLEERKHAPAVAPARPAAAAAAPTGAPAATTPGGGFHVPAYYPGENVAIEPMSKIRQRTAAHMRYSKDTSAHVTTVFHMDLSRVHRAREQAKNGFFKANATKLSYMPFIFKSVASALKANPKLNAAIDGTNVVFKKDINLGMAVALDWGLLVPVIKHADAMNLVGLAKTANDLAERARSKKLKPEEATGGTFTITNPGVFGSLFGTPIINQPQVAILGIGAVEKRAVVVTDEDGYDALAIRMMAYFGISYDHRLVDGADADHFMNHVKKSLIEDSWSELDPYR
jgi:2-oxoglutarate dehydrogenase dihydrolipoamide succinyltransferase (E2 component)